MWLVVMIRTRPSCEATPSRMLRRPEREMRPPEGGAVGGLAGLVVVEPPGTTVTRGLASSASCSPPGDFLVCVRPAVSMSSSRTTHCWGSSENSCPRFSSFMASEFRDTM